jgi:hypothetical protein
METHKHAGIVKSHPINRVHTDPVAVKAHKQALLAKNAVKEFKEKKKPTFIDDLDQGSKNYKSMAMEFSIDNDNYIMIDLTKDINVEGVRIKFKRRTQTIGLQIEK